jgi:hypothetical protein
VTVPVCSQLEKWYDCLNYFPQVSKGQMPMLKKLQETNIYAQFDVVFSLVHRMSSSMSIIQSKQVKTAQSVEVGYYNLKSEQMSLFNRCFPEQVSIKIEK